MPTLAPLCWRRRSAGWYFAVGAPYDIFRVHLDDGPWWILRSTDDGSTSDPIRTLAEAKACADAELA